jgi:hypothetical protein
MPIEVLNQIQYLCKLISKVEWSGALFYTTEGSIEKPETFKVTLKTILPLDMGSQAYTEYSLDNRFIDFIEEDFEERCTWKLAHIHSHNNMAVFFSGTDMAELNDNAPAHNFYLSLIVNNAMDFLAKIAFIGEAKKDIKQIPYTAKNVQGLNYVIEKQDFEVNTQKLFIFDCDISSPLKPVSVTEQFAAQVAKIMEPKPVKTFSSQSQLHQGTTFGNKDWSKNWGNGWSKGSRDQKQINTWNEGFKRPHTPTLFEDWDLPTDKAIEELAEYDLKAQSIYNFAKDLFSYSSSPLDEEETVEDILDILAEYELTPQEVAKSIINNYAKIFAKHFPKASASDFVQYTHETVDLLDDISMLYPEIKLTIKTISSMIDKFISHETERHNTTK